MREKRFSHNKKLTPYARELRNNATSQENHLWYDYLRCYPVQFKRQVTVDRFILDFYCSSAKLAIEIDGAQHYDENKKQYDAARTNVLKQYGIMVIRFSNSDVDERFDDVCEVIDTTITSILAF